MCELADDYYKVIESHCVKARKSHICCACDEPILTGHRYWKTFALLNEPETYKHCLRCWAMLEAIRHVAEPGTAIAWRLDCGELWKNNFGEIPEKVAQLAFFTSDEAQKLLDESSLVRQ